jgi:ribosome biogenesis GTPase
LTEQLRDHTSVFIGQSGVGKSSLISELLPEMGSIRIGSVSEGTGKGRHTTTTARLYYFPSGGKLIDSPGIRDFSFSHLTTDDLARGFIEFREFLGHCKFSNCSHTHEPDCAIRAAVSSHQISENRWHSYQQILLSL